MIEQFKDLLDIEEVLGIMLLLFNGNIAFKQFKLNMPEGTSDLNLSSFIHALNNAKEAELHYENRLIYILRARTGFILVIMERSAPIALVRLSCGIIVHAINNKINKTKWLWRLFTKRVRDY